MGSITRAVDHFPKINDGGPKSFCPGCGRQESYGKCSCVQSTAVRTIEAFLKAEGAHIATHDEGYGYLNGNDFCYRDHLSHPIDPYKALDEGMIEIIDGRIVGCGLNLPVKIDYDKLLRRTRDALNKTSNMDAIVKVASLLNVKL